MITLEMMPALMFAGLVVFMLIGYPAAFSLAAAGLFFGLLAIHLGFFEPTLLQALPQRVFGIMSNELLLAIPFFTFMGTILERCGLAEDLLDGMGQLMGPIPGGLGYAVILVGAILGAVTGTVAASVIAMGVIALPAMMRYGYNLKYASGVIAASGTITQLIPPSLVLIVLADQLGRSVGDMYAGAWGPSAIQVLLFMLYTFVLSLVRPQWMPPLPRSARTLSGWPLVKRCLKGIVPSLALIFLVLGTLLLGLATPTESGAMGAVGAILLALLHSRHFSRTGRLAGVVALLALAAVAIPGVLLMLAERFPQLASDALANFYGVIKRPLYALFYLCVIYLLLEAARIAELRGLIRQALGSTMRITSMVIFILIGSTFFTLVFQGVNGSHWIEGLLTALPGGVIGFLVFVNVFIFVLAFFLDFFEIAFIVIPLLVPVAQALGIDLIWFGVLICVNMQTSFMHPPFGFALFYLRGIAAKEVKSSDIYWGAVPFVLIQVLMVAIVIAFPQLVTIGLDKAEPIDPDKVEIIMPDEDAAKPDAEDDPAKAIERFLERQLGK